MNSQKGVYLIEFICMLFSFWVQLQAVTNSLPIERPFASTESVHSNKFKRKFWEVPARGNERHDFFPISFSNLNPGLKANERTVPIPGADSIYKQSLFESQNRKLVLQKNDSRSSSSDTKEKESQIAEVFIGVAYGTPSTEAPYTAHIYSNNTQVEGKIKKYFPLIQPSVSPYKQTYRDVILKMESQKNEKNYYLIKQPNRIQTSLNVFQEKPESLVREIPTVKINFSLPQLFVSTKEIKKVGQSNFSLTTEKISLSNQYTLNYKKKDLNNNKNYPLIAKTEEASSTQRKIFYNQNVSNTKLNFANDTESYKWLIIRSSYPSAWIYHDYFSLILFSLLSLFPLVILIRLHFIKKDHITPRHCSLLMVQLLIVCISRVVLYSVDPFSVQERFSYTVVLIFNDVIQSVLISSIGIFLVILIFPVYRPKSQLFPRLTTCFISLLLFIKISFYVFFALQNKSELFKRVKTFISTINFGENGTLAIGYIFLNLCTKQRHKIWWIRIYKKSLISSKNYSFSVLYSKLKQSIRFGSCAAFIQLFITFMSIIAEYERKLLYLSLYYDLRLVWVEESVKRFCEGLVCLFLILGVNFLFAPKVRSVIKKRSAFKTFLDIIKGRRRSKSKFFIGRKKNSFNIFTLNRNRKTPDYVATDFQLVWSQNKTLPLFSISDKERRKSARSLDFVESSMSLCEKNEKSKISHSVDILNNIEGTPLPNFFPLYDNLQAPKSQTPIYQNQYFHYNYQPKIHEPAVSAVCSTKKNIPHLRESKKKAKKKTRPKSFVDDRTKLNENYLTSYFSVLSMDKFVDSDFREYATQFSNENKATPGNVPPFSFEEINSPMISNEKWKDIKITPKFCTIKINSKNKKKLASSKSVDLF